MHDIVIIGGGSSGCVLAARLSEDGQRSVLLIEAGNDYPDHESAPDAVRLAVGGQVAAEQLEALDWGLINSVVPDDKVLDEARALATKLANGPTNAFGGAKRLLIDGASSALEAAMEREAFAIARQASHPEALEGIDAFLNKRKPNFRQ